MDTPAYRYLLTDLLTDRLLAELPLTGVSFDRRISRVGALSGTLVAPSKHLVDLGKLMHTYAGRAALWVYRDSALWWGPALGAAAALAGSFVPAWNACRVKVSEVFARTA